MKKIVFTFGRYNPPTTGHAELITYAVKKAQKTGAEHRIYTSQSHDPSKNPLSAAQKFSFLRQIFPGVNFVADASIKTVFDICKKLTNEGYEDVTFIVGADRLDEFRTQLGKYVKPKSDPSFNPKINYPFKSFKVESSGARKKGISGTDLRAAVRKGDFATFAKASAAKDRTLARKIFDATRSQLKEEYLTEEGMSRKEFHEKLMSFVDFTCKQLGIDEAPSIKYKEEKGEGQPSFGGYAPGSKELMVYTKNRHPMDIFRTVAHELVHHKQNLDGRLGKDITKEGATGSDIENEANADAGKVMRYFGKENPFYFDMNYVMENKAIILAGTPGSGKDKILKEAILPHGFTEISTENFHSSPIEGNIVVNGSTDYSKVSVIKEALELRGYNTIMVFVNTSDQVSKQRNEARSLKGGRVINETARFAKWRAAQDNLNKFDRLFEKVIEVKNDLDANVIAETYSKFMDSVSKEIEEFALSETDRKFERMLNEVGGAGNWGTSQLTDRYKQDTPGEEPGGFKIMKVLDTTSRNKSGVPRDAKPAPMPSLPIGADRIGPEAGMPKEPSFGDNQTLPFATVNDPIGRWMVKEETRKRFKEKYGKLAEQKLRETAIKLAQRESLEDPYSSWTGATPNAWEAETNRPTGGYQVDLEKDALFGSKLRKNMKRLNTKGKPNFFKKGN